MKLPFLKMHGLGNDFVVFDARRGLPVPVDGGFLIGLADRRRGVGCDQIIILRPAVAKTADLYMEMYNADGSVVRACGNATRCVARLLFNETGRDAGVIETVAGLLMVRRAGVDAFTVDFGPPRLEWAEIPLAQAVDTLRVPLVCEVLRDPCCVNMGNPHAVFFVDDADAVDLARLGLRLEHDRLFPDRCNVEAAQVLAPDRIRMRVWERGTGITMACGTAACATLVAAHRRGLTGRRAIIVMDGGEVTVDWQADGHVLLTGPAAQVYEGVWPG